MKKIFYNEGGKEEEVEITDEECEAIERFKKEIGESIKEKLIKEFENNLKKFSYDDIMFSKVIEEPFLELDYSIAGNEFSVTTKGKVTTAPERFVDTSTLSIYKASKKAGLDVGKMADLINGKGE